MHQCCCYCWYSYESNVRIRVVVVVIVVVLQEPIFVVVVNFCGCDFEAYL